MKEKERPILFVSLALNLLLAILLILSYTREPDVTVIANIPAEAVDPDTETPSPTPTYTPTPGVTATSEPTATNPPTATAVPTNTPTPTLPPSPTATPTIAATATPPPTPTPTEVPDPEWLVYINTFRAMSGVRELLDNPDWSFGSLEHSTYMVETGDITHDPNPSSPWYTEAGRLAAYNGNIAATEWNEATYVWAINYWMAAPFHGLPMLDPELNSVGFGFFSKSSSLGSNIGGVNVAATLDILSGLVQPSLEFINYPIYFPPDGGVTWVLKHSLYEYPNPLSACPGYSRPTGPPIMIQMGSGSGRPTVNGYSFTSNGSISAACLFTESSYTNDSAAAQSSGRGILNARDAIVIIPLNPLVVGNQYRASVTVDGVNYSTTFTAVDPPD